MGDGGRQLVSFSVGKRAPQGEPTPLQILALRFKDPKLLENAAGKCADTARSFLCRRGVSAAPK